MNTDHASAVIDLDFTNTSRGKGIFRSPPNAHNDLTYTRLIKNSIQKSIFSCIKQNNKADLEIALFEASIKLEEELYSLETKTPTWNTHSRQNTLLHYCTMSSQSTNQTS